MAVKWTDKQLDAINARNTAVIVSAAAGSGKTAVLVERLLRILSDTENKVSADRLVVVTFTNDAAAQMKQRLSEALSKQIELEPDNMWLCRQQALIPSAKISTIHSFCFDLIRENVQSLDISSGFRILDDTEEKLIVSKALSNVFEKFYADAPELMNELSDFTCQGARGDIQLEETVLGIHRFINSIPFPEDWLEAAANEYSKPFDPNTDVLAAEYVKLLCDELESYALSADYALELVSEAGGGKAEEILNNEREMFIQARDTLSNSSLCWNDRINIDIGKWETCRYPKTEDGSYERSLVDRAKDIRADYKEKFNKIVSEKLFTEENINDDYAVNCRILKGLSRLVKALMAEISTIKSEKNGLGFSDAEQLAVKLLCYKDENGEIRRTPLAKELSEYYKVIMIDEFQDANNTQNIIFRMLSHNGTADKNGDNIFVVGDVKQSIYRFRLANPKIFINVLNSADEYTSDYSGDNAAVLLNRNFRSSNDVVDFVNDVFGCIMSEKTGEIDYTDSEKLELGAEYPPADRAAEFIFIDEIDESPEPPEVSESSDEQPDNSDDETAAEINAEAHAAAVKIKSMLGKAMVYDHSELRPCENRDFCILLRDRGRGQLYADALAAAGIRAYCEETTGYLHSREISVLVNLLTVIDNPMQDIPLVSVLMSPMFMLTAEETAELRLVSDEHIYKCILAVLDDENKAAYSAAKKLEVFMKIYKKLRICAASQSLERLIRTIYDSTDFLASVQVYADGEQKKANLRLLLEYAKSYEQNSAGGLSGFIRYLRDISENGGDFVRASVISPADNVVSIKTIHKSKGLEYPFVFLCGTSKNFNLRDNYDRMQINLDYGIGFKIQDRKTLRLYNSYPQSVLSSINRRDTVSEEMRLLYVALTRAKEQLFITVPYDSKTQKRIASICTDIASAGGINDNVSSRAVSMQDWLLAVLLTHPDGHNIQSDLSVPIRSSNAKIRVTKFSDSEAEKILDTAAVKAAPDSQKVKELLDIFDFKYDTKLADTAAKLTITEIAKSENDEIFLRRPDFSADYSKLTPAEIGTAMHTFMQYSDYEKAESDLKGQADILVEKGILSAEERDALQYGKLAAFFRSPLYSRMKKSAEIRREQKFLIEISALSLDDELGMEYNNTNGMLQGIADCFFAEEDGIVLIDYKTDRVNNEQTLIDRYYRQLYLYSIALEKIFGRKVKEAYLYSFGLDREIKIL